jgi:hypothetical protein
VKRDVAIIRKLLEALSKKTGQSMDHAGYREMQAKIPGLGDDYLYKKLDRKIAFLQDHEMVGIGPFQLNKILEYLGYESLDAFRSHVENPYGDQLMSLTGNYYCYVRASHVEGRVLRSPVRIFHENGLLRFELYGKDHVYKGEMALTDGILYILMSAPIGKTFHHVYKIGKRYAPRIMQGVFSGVSSAPDPIGGRTILARQNEPFERLENKKIPVEVMKASSELEEIRVGSYFEHRDNNNLSPFKSSDFGFDDLIPG